MVTTPHPTDSPALPGMPASATQATPATPPPPSHMPQTERPASSLASAKPRTTPAKRARKPASKTAADTPASRQPPVKRAAAQKTPASPVPASKTIAKANTTLITPKLGLLKATAAKPAARKVPASKTTPQKPVSAKAAAPKVTTLSKAVSSKPVTPASTTKKPVASKPKKEAKKEKLVRDSFTIPKSEFAVLDQLKRRANVIAGSVKKSELLRAGIKLLAGLSNDALLSALSQVPTIKTGRPALKK